MCDEARESTVAPEHDEVQPPSPEHPSIPEAVPEPVAESVPEPVPESAPEPPAAPEAAPAVPVEAAPPSPPPAERALSPEERAEKMARLTQLLDGAEQVLAARDLPDARTRWNA